MCSLYIFFPFLFLFWHDPKYNDNRTNAIKGSLNTYWAPSHTPKRSFQCRQPSTPRDTNSPRRWLAQCSKTLSSRYLFTDKLMTDKTQQRLVSWREGTTCYQAASQARFASRTPMTPRQGQFWRGTTLHHDFFHERRNASQLERCNGGETSRIQS